MVPRTAPVTKNYLAPRVRSTVVEKPWCSSCVWSPCHSSLGGWPQSSCGGQLLGILGCDCYWLPIMYEVAALCFPASGLTAENLWAWLGTCSVNIWDQPSISCATSCSLMQQSEDLYRAPLQIPGQTEAQLPAGLTNRYSRHLLT